MSSISCATSSWSVQRLAIVNAEFGQMRDGIVEIFGTRSPMTACPGERVRHVFKRPPFRIDLQEMRVGVEA